MHCSSLLLRDYWIWTLKKPHQNQQKPTNSWGFFFWFFLVGFCLLFGFFLVHVYSDSCLKPVVIPLVTAWPDTSCLLMNHSEVMYCILGHAYSHLGWVESRACYTFAFGSRCSTKCIMCNQVCSFTYSYLLSPYVQAWSCDPSQPSLECCRDWLLAMNLTCRISNLKYQMERLVDKITWVRIICNEQGLMFCVCWRFSHHQFLL